MTVADNAAAVLKVYHTQAACAMGAGGFFVGECGMTKKIFEVSGWKKNNMVMTGPIMVTPEKVVDVVSRCVYAPSFDGFPEQGEWALRDLVVEWEEPGRVIVIRGSKAQNTGEEILSTPVEVRVTIQPDSCIKISSQQLPEEKLKRLGEELEHIAGADADKQASELFVRGTWASDFDTLGKLLQDFGKENQNKPFGKDALLFTFYGVEINDGRLVKENPIERNWLIGSHSHLITDIAGNRNPDFEGFPYGKVIASRGPGGLFVELRHGVAYRDSIQAYLKRLLDFLILRGFQIKTSPDTATAEGMASALRDDLLSRLGIAETPQPAANGAAKRAWEKAEEFEHPYPFKGTPAQFGITAHEVDKEFAVNGARYPLEGLGGVASIGELRPDAKPVTVSYYETTHKPYRAILRLRIEAQCLPDNKSRLLVKIDESSTAAKQKWEGLCAEMKRLGWLGTEQLGADNAGKRPIHVFDKSGAIATPISAGIGPSNGVGASDDWRNWLVTHVDPVTSASTFTDPSTGNRVVAIPQVTSGAKGGQPDPIADNGGQKEKRGMKAGTDERVRTAHRLLKQGNISQRDAFKQAHTDSRTYNQYCKQVTGEEPIEPYTE